MHGKEILVTRPSMPPLEEYTEILKDIWESQWLTNMGAKHRELQQELEQYLSVQHVDLLTNGHMALELSMQALGLRGEVITTPFTFASTTHAIIRNQLQPVFCDIDPTDFTIDADKLEDLITEKTCAIVPVHVYGNVCNVEKIERIAKKYNLKVIYDAAHAFGVRYKGKGIASYGDVSCFSFHATKVYHTIEGGAVCFKNDEEGQTFGLNIYRLKNFGIRGPETVDAVGTNAKMNEFCASMGICNLRHVDEEIAKRKKVTAVYRRFLEDVPGIQLNSLQADVISNNSYFPVIFDKQIFGADRNMVAERLAADHIYARKYFYPLTTAFDAFQGQYDPRKTPVALRISENVLTLPLYAELPLTEAERIARLVLECRKGF